MWLSIQIILIVIAVAVILVYLTGYGYIFNGISKTYFKGKLSANIDDGPYFPANTVRTTAPKPWEKASEYNTCILPEDLIHDLESSCTASFIIVKNGKLVHEQYWNGYHAESSTNSFSMAKAVTVMLLGKAIEEQKVSSIETKFSAFFEEFNQKEYGKELTLKHLARMESGLDWEENYKNPFLPNAKAYYGKSLISATFPRKFKEHPGSRFEYQSGSTQLLGFAVRKAIDQTLAGYLSEKFWIPMGMEHNATWSTDESGMEKTYCCIHSNARDFAKLGQLFLDNGRVGQKQILNEDFIEQMRTPTEHSGHIYGMGLWINHDNPVKHYYFLGLQGQYIIMIPEYDMVIVRTGSYHNLPKNDRGRPDQVKFLVNTAVALFQ